MFTLSQGSGDWQRGHGDVAAIASAVLIAVSGTSADNPPLLSTREKPLRFAMSGFVRDILRFVRLFLSAVAPLSAGRNYCPGLDFASNQPLTHQLD